MKLGVESTVSEPCFPIVVSHGHIRWLLEKARRLRLRPEQHRRARRPPAAAQLLLPVAPDAAVRGALGAVHLRAARQANRADALVQPGRAIGRGVAARGLRRRRAALAGAPASDAAVARGFARRSSAFRASLVDAGRRGARDPRRRRRARSRPAGPPLQHLRRRHQPRDRHQAAGVLRRERRRPSTSSTSDAGDLARYEADIYWSYGAKILATAAFTREPAEPAPHLPHELQLRSRLVREALRHRGFRPAVPRAAGRRPQQRRRVC